MSRIGRFSDWRQLGQQQPREPRGGPCSGQCGRVHLCQWLDRALTADECVSKIETSSMGSRGGDGQHSMFRLFPMGLLDIRKALKVSQASRKWHCDVGNSGLSAILALGDYTGGAFETEDRKVDIHNAIFILEGSKPHRSRDK
jgi:hypothetical protein